MKRLSSPPRYSRPLLGTVALLSTLLVGCSSGLATPEDPGFAATGDTTDNRVASDPAVIDPQSGAEPDPADPTPTATAGTESRTAAADPAATAADNQADACARTDTELINTGFGAHTVANRIPVADDPDTVFSFDIAESHFDPCTELSWIVLSGSLGDQADQDGTEASPGESVVFFHGDELITDPLPIMMDSVESVERTAPNEVAVTYGQAAESTAGGVTETLPSTHTWARDALDSDLSELSAATGDDLTRIDVAAAPLTPAAETTGVSQTLAAGQYRLPINDNQNLLCDIGHADGPVADCYADFPTTWKMVSNQRPQATRIIFTEEPAHARGTADPTPTASRAQSYGQVQGDTTLQIGEAVVDLTQPNQATITTADAGILITPDSFEVVGGQSS